MADKPRQPWIAAILTLVTKGLGHLYAGSPGKGLILFGIEQCLLIGFGLSALVIVPDTYFLLSAVIIGVTFTIFCVVDAVSIAKKKKEHYKLAKYNKWYVYICYFVIFSILVSTLVSSVVKGNLIKAYKIPSGAMEPALLIGDHILVRRSKSARDPQRGDLVVFEYPVDPGKDFVKRVVAMGGDTVEVRNKELLVNDKPMTETYVVHNEVGTFPASQNPRDNFGPQVVPADSYFLMGDNRDRSYDSRFWGVVAKDKVKGTVESIYWSWDRDNSSIRWDRIGMKVQ